VDLYIKALLITRFAATANNKPMAMVKKNYKRTENKGRVKGFSIALIRK
jgi:hypothetical protein